MKKIPSLALCAAAVAILSSCKPAQPAAEATPTPAPTATPASAATPTPAAAGTPAGASASTGLELKDPVAVVNGEPITKAQLEEAFNQAVAASGMKAADLTDEQKLEGYNQILNELITEKLVSKAAGQIEVTDADVDAELAKAKKQFPNEEEFEKQLAQAGQSMDKVRATIKSMLQQQRWVQSQVGSATQVSDADAQKFYNDNKAEFEEGPTVRASHILFMVKPDDSKEVSDQKLEAAKKAAARAKKEDFTALAKELSEEPGAKQSGGDLGYFTKERMVPEFADAAFSQKVGTVSEPVKTQFGWHVIKVVDTKPAHTVPYAEVKDQVIAYLNQDKQRAAVQELIKKMTDSAKIERNLPPPPAAPAAMGMPAGAPGALPSSPGDMPATAEPSSAVPATSPAAQ